VGGGRRSERLARVRVRVYPHRGVVPCRVEGGAEWREARDGLTGTGRRCGVSVCVMSGGNRVGGDIYRSREETVAGVGRGRVGGCLVCCRRGGGSTGHVAEIVVVGSAPRGAAARETAAGCVLRWVWGLQGCALTC